ncbi:MAG: hypothetical protein Q3997_07865 [Propionibacteriaceae bacterium]|nr:hypothetical protein [Propionibacteriaceae bacterium]
MRIAQIEPGASISPSKAELLRPWLATQPWFRGDASTAEIVGAYRFVDPAGQVGLEGQIVLCGGQTYHVPLTYRGAPLEGGEPALVGTMAHSTLGRRWVYDGESDPVFLDELARVIAEGDTEAERSLGAKTAWVRGSGASAREPTPRVLRRPVPEPPACGGWLTGRWLVAGREESGVLALLC